MATPRFILTPRQREALELLKNPDNRYVLLAGGSRSGKTAVICYAMVLRALYAACKQVILRYHFLDVKQSVGMDTLKKILDLVIPKNSHDIFYDEDKTNSVFLIHGMDQSGRRFVSEIWLAGLDDKDRTEKILGREFSTIYFNEASQISYEAYTMAATRLAENVAGMHRKIIIDCNPPEKSHWLYQMFIQKKIPETLQGLRNPEQYVMFVMNPIDNPHLPPDYLETLSALPERQRRRFLEGEWLDKRQGALFKADDIERNRVDVAPSYLSYAVVGIDPAISSSEEADETGIVAVGLSADGGYYVLADASVRGSPDTWAARVDAVYRTLHLGGAVYESNQGGEMVEHTIRTANPLIPCNGVRATRGKALRAEPVAALYAQNKVHHVGRHTELEDQMCSWVPGDLKSPDRLDALVWAVTYLMDRPVISPYQPEYPCASSYRESLKYPNMLGKSERSRGQVYGNVKRPVFGRGWGNWGR